MINHSLSSILTAALLLAGCVAGDPGPGGPGGGGGSGGAGADGGSTDDITPTPTDRRIVGYFTAWAVYGRNFHVADIPGDKLTHINYAFANISDSGECVLGDPYADIDKFYDGDSWDAGALRGSFNQLRLLKERYPHLRTLISLGGWTWSSRFSDVALTDESRRRFAASCVEFMRTYGFDGIDVDWEYPVSGGLETNTTRPEDKQNYTLLLRELRRQLDEVGGLDDVHYLLTIAAPAGPAVYANLELDQIAEPLDWINIMTYDFHGGWSATTNFNAPLYAASGDPSVDESVRTKFNVDAAVQAYLAAGIPAGKLVIGAAFYGRGFAGVSPGNDGLFQPFTGLPQGTWEPGVFDYEDLAQNYVGTYQRHVHPEAKVPWLYDPATGTMISYDDPESMKLKADYITQHDLGGVMFWELSGDDAQWSLLTTLATNL